MQSLPNRFDLAARQLPVAVVEIGQSTSTSHELRELPGRPALVSYGWKPSSRATAFCRSSAVMKLISDASSER